MTLICQRGLELNVSLSDHETLVCVAQKQRWKSCSLRKDDCCFNWRACLLCCPRNHSCSG